ncbi:hypothetical protein L4X63_09685 [Geomonas sp. Red32]|uniref:hypothetical protein n=1 Tax=Geomonas sp. Red32 TaxID=2912856 RepID=UPI00202CFBA0|nr:hypothetical protein [Geomonas sp. Red32]MCM0081860.1 hypothetical protein [Geomonas sp. Red32]
MKHPVKVILLLILFAALATWLYPTVIGYWATLYIPLASKLPRTRIAQTAWLSAGGASGAAICAFLLAWPLGFIIREKPIIIGSVFGVLSAVFPWIAFIATISENGFNGFVTTIFVTEQITFIVGSICFTYLGSRFSTKKASRDLTND